MARLNDEVLQDIKNREQDIADQGGYGEIRIKFNGESDFVDVTHEITTRHYVEVPKAGKKYYMRQG